MRTTVTIEAEKINDLLSETQVKSKARAVLIAVDYYLRSKKLERITGLKGKLTFALSADEIRHVER